MAAVRSWSVRKLIGRALVLLLPGAALNIAVAWGFALAINLLLVEPVPAITGTSNGRWEVMVYARTGAVLVYSGRFNLGRPQPFREREPAPEDFVPSWAPLHEPLPDFELSTPIHTEHRYCDARGFPLLSMWSERRLVQQVDRGRRRSTGARPFPTLEEGIETPWPWSVAGGTWPRDLSLRPIWPGFAINTLLYAAILWALFATPGVIRRRLCRNRGRCPACGYPIGTSDVCTECGATVPPRAEGTT